MTQHGSNPDPYTQSGAHAAARQRCQILQDARSASLRDADALQQHAGTVILRGRRGVRLGAGLFALLAAGTVLLGWVALDAFESGPDGMLRGNWAMLGFVAGLGALNFAWGWTMNQRRLAETGRRLIRRAEHQRGMAMLQQREDEHEALR